jgi:hypothetical protein
MERRKYEINEYIDEHYQRWTMIIDTELNEVVFKEKNISKEFMISIADSWNTLNESIKNKEL